jgi:hypothetical protein
VRNQASTQQAELIALAIRGIDAQIADLESKRAALLGQVGTRTVSAPAAQKTAVASAAAAVPRKRSKFSAAHRAKLKAAAKLRWANARAKQVGTAKTTRPTAQKSVRKAAK